MSIITTHKAGETFVCDCGNTPDSDGFFPCDEAGRIIEPTADSDWDGLYNTPDSDGFFPCDEAGRIIEPTADSDWDGLYVCERCGQLHREEEVVAW